MWAYRNLRALWSQTKCKKVRFEDGDILYGVNEKVRILRRIILQLIVHYLTL
jgi:hypothetical protein